MELEILLRQYDRTLNSYRILNTEYLDYLKNNSQSVIEKDFTSIDNFKIDNPSTISSPITTSIEECKAACAKTTLCTGATYKEDTNAKTCDLKSGENGLIIEKNSKAILTKKKKYLKDLKDLNDVLTSLNDQIQKTINENKKNMVEDLDDKEVNLQSLKNNLIFLKNEKGNIEKQIKDVKELENKINDGSKLVEQYRSILYVLGFIFFFIIVYIVYSKISMMNFNFQNIFNSSLK